MIFEDTYYIHALSVKPEFQGKRVGYALIENAINKAREQGFAKLQLDVLSDNPAVGFYRAVGLELLAETTALNPLLSACRPSIAWVCACNGKHAITICGQMSRTVTLAADGVDGCKLPIVQWAQNEKTAIDAFLRKQCREMPFTPVWKNLTNRQTVQLTIRGRTWHSTSEVEAEDHAKMALQLDAFARGAERRLSRRCCSFI